MSYNLIKSEVRRQLGIPDPTGFSNVEGHEIWQLDQDTRENKLLAVFSLESHAQEYVNYLNESIAADQELLEENLRRFE